MTEQAPYRISRDILYEKPEPQEGVPITRAEWRYLQNKIKPLTSRAGIVYNTIGSLLLGVSIKTGVSVITEGFPSSGDNDAYLRFIRCCALALVTFICGGVFIFFARQRRRDADAKRYDVLQYMRLIEGPKSSEVNTPPNDL